ncbi:unnamed protein product, partial [Ilex paraguariensis]
KHRVNLSTYGLLRFSSLWFLRSFLLVLPFSSPFFSAFCPESVSASSSLEYLPAGGFVRHYHHRRDANFL